jgi:predicted glycoside hydrolase/deacetylase ChbG (UPF0249 family)
VTTKAYLIVNADDFGLSPGVNNGVLRAHEEGIVTSTSLMVRRPAAAEAAELGRLHPNLGIGLHVDLGEWRYISGEWLPVYEVVPLSDPAAVAQEARRQLSVFRRLVGDDPTHVDSHQHVHRKEPARSALIDVAQEIGVPLRQHSPEVRYCGDFYGQTAEGDPWPDAITLEGLIRIIEALSAGFTELACHPGDDVDLDSVYRSERAREVEVLCHPKIREAVGARGIQLCSFKRVRS